MYKSDNSTNSGVYSPVSPIPMFLLEPSGPLGLTREPRVLVREVKSEREITELKTERERGREIEGSLGSLEGWCEGES